MSIRILPDSEIKAAASSFHAPALLFANPKISINVVLHVSLRFQMHIHWKTIFTLQAKFPKRN